MSPDNKESAWFRSALTIFGGFPLVRPAKVVGLERGEREDLPLRLERPKSGSSGQITPASLNAEHRNEQGGGFIHHAFKGSGRPLRDLGDGSVDNAIHDATGAPSIDATNMAESEAYAVNNSGVAVGRADFYVDASSPPENRILQFTR